MNTLTAINAEARHEAQMKAEQAAEEIGKSHALANLMNAHTGMMPIAKITAIFENNPPLAAHIICKQISPQNSMRTNSGDSQTAGKSTRLDISDIHKEINELNISICGGMNTLGRISDNQNQIKQQCKLLEESQLIAAEFNAVLPSSSVSPETLLAQLVEGIVRVQVAYNCSQLDAITRMQESAHIAGDNKSLELLSEIKWQLIMIK